MLGRNDAIQNFQGTQRSLSLGWQVVAFSLGDQGSAENNLAKCSTLARMLYPQYSDVDNATSISKAPLIKLRFSNLIFDGSQTYGASAATTGLLGVITNLGWTPMLDAGFLDPDTRLYPKVIDMTINFNVLHQHPLGWETSEGGGMPQGPGSAGNFPWGRALAPAAGVVLAGTDEPAGETATDVAQSNQTDALGG